MKTGLRALAATTAALATWMLAGACSHDQTPSGAPQNGGPLGVSLDGGGNSLAAPRNSSHWTGTFGSLDLCTDSGDPLTLRKISYDFKDRPLSATSSVRVLNLPPDQDRTPQQAPILALRGSIDDLFAREFYASELAKPEGHVVDRPCSAGPHAVFDELMTSMTVDTAGGWISGIRIEYTAGSATYVRDVDWNYVMCGTAIADQRAC